MSKVDDNRCAESVWDRSSWRHFQCSRKPGYGRAGLYCKQHAKKHPADDIETEVMYAANWSLGSKFRLARCRVSDVTEKTLIIRSVDDLLGWPPHTGLQYARSGGEWLFFATAREAIQWGAEVAQRRFDDLVNKVARAEKELAMLTGMLAADSLDEMIDQINAGPRGVPTGPLTLD